MEVDSATERILSRHSDGSRAISRNPAEAGMPRGARKGGITPLTLDESRIEDCSDPTVTRGAGAGARLSASRC